MSREEKCINCLRKADIGRPGAEILTPGGKIKKIQDFLMTYLTVDVTLNA